MAFLKPLVTARSAQLTARATDIMVGNATPEKVGIASSGGRARLWIFSTCPAFHLL
jgi:hypothetical protein